MLASHKPNTKVGFKTKFTTPKPFNFATENRAVVRAGSGMQRFRNLQELSPSERLASHNPHKGIPSIASNFTVTKPLTFTTAERALKYATIASNSTNLQELSASEKLASYKPHKDKSFKASNVTVTKPFTFTTAERALRRATTANNSTNVQNGQEGAESSLRSGAKGKNGRGGYSARLVCNAGTRKEKNSQSAQKIAAQPGTSDNTPAISRTVEQLSSLSSVDFDVPDSERQEVEPSETQSVTTQQQHLRVQEPERHCLSFGHVVSGFELDTYHSNEPFVKDSCTPTSEFSPEITEHFLKAFSRSVSSCELLMPVFGKVPTQISLPFQRLEECCVDPNVDTVQKYHIPACNPRAPNIRLSSTSVSLQMSVVGNHHRHAGNFLPQNAETRHGTTMLSRYLEPLFESTAARGLKRMDERALVVDLKGCFVKIRLSLSNIINGTIVPSSPKESWGSCFWNLEIYVEVLHEDSRLAEVRYEVQHLWEIFNGALLPQGSASLVINKFCLSHGEIFDPSSDCSQIKGVNGQRTNGYSYDGCAPQSNSHDPCCHFEVYPQSPSRLLPISEPVRRHPVTEIHLSHMPCKGYFNPSHASERSLMRIIDHSYVHDQYQISRGINEPEQFLALPSRHASVMAKGPDLAHEACFGQGEVMVMQIASLADKIVAEDKLGQSLTDISDKTGDSGIQIFENDSPGTTTKLSPLFEQLHAINVKHRNIKVPAAEGQCARFEKAKHFEDTNVKMVNGSSATPSCKGALDSGKKRGIEINSQELVCHHAKLDVAHQKGSLTPHTGNQARAKSSYTPYTGKEINSYKNHTVFIRGFDKSLHVDQIRSSLKEHFGFCGEIIRVSIPLVPETGCPKGFAFMVFKDEDSFDLALELNGIYLGGYALYVDQARSEIDRGEGRGRGGGDHRGRGSFDRGGHGGRGRFF